MSVQRQATGTTAQRGRGRAPVNPRRKVWWPSIVETDSREPQPARSKSKRTVST